MQVVFAHYHLNPGGVTQVIANQILALSTLPQEQRPHRIGMLYGGRKDGWSDRLWKNSLPFELVLLPVTNLDYDYGEPTNADLLFQQVFQKLVSHGFHTKNTLLHIHNHALGKNVSWPAAVTSLAKKGYRLLLQIHDFAEDYRPVDYRRLAQSLETNQPEALAQQLYPQASGITYATLTHRDAVVLRRAGVAEDRAHILPNTAAEFNELPRHDAVAEKVREQLGIPDNAQLALYPVRGIRRKNIGELLLYSAISQENTWHAVTLAPKNPVERRWFDHWRALAEELKLRVLFNICGDTQISYPYALAGSDWLITTSVAEGFGMVFLEAWLVGKQLVGRKLPGITEEFEAAGIQFGGLREAFQIPLAWITHRAKLAKALQEAYLSACCSFGVKPDPEEVAQARLLTENDLGTIDFALLPSKFQRQIICHAANEMLSSQTELEALNPGSTLPQVVETLPTDIIAANANVVRSTYSLETIARKMQEIYQQLASSPLGGWQPLSNGETILKSFLQVDRLSPIRFEENP